VKPELAWNRAVAALERIADALEVANHDRALHWSRNDQPTVEAPPVFDPPKREGDLDG